MSSAQFLLGRPLGGGRPLPPSRNERRKAGFSTIIGIDHFPGESVCGAGVELQLRARHSYAGFLKSWFASLISLRGRSWPIGILVLYLAYLLAIVSFLLLVHGDHISEDSALRKSEIPVHEIGVALFFLLGFRTNNSYEHWWQARQKWSVIQARSMNMLRETVAYVDDLGARENLLRWHVALLVTMKAHLREDRDVSELLSSSILTQDEMNMLMAVPDMVAHCFVRLSDLVYDIMNEKQSRQPQLILQMARDNLKQISESFYVADGIRVTPLPYAYIVHLRFFLLLWLLVLPISYTVILRWWAILACFLLGVALFGFDRIATQNENPYGHEFNDIPLDAIVQRSKDIVLHYLLKRTENKIKFGKAS